MLEDELPRLYGLHGPVATLRLGVAPRRRMVSVETRALNRTATHLADAEGFCFTRTSLEQNGPRNRPATLPAGTLIEAIRRTGVPVRTSRDAGD
ncbi:MAG: hypothetical protein QNJ43_14235 [Breoghania sp.]|nr:hypothetical protein [Breoghania sp.]